MANIVGKRYVCTVCGSEFIVTKGGEGTLTCHGQPMQMKDAQSGKEEKPPSLDGEGETEALAAPPEPDVEEVLAPPRDGDLVAGRAHAVGLARQVVEGRWRAEAIESDVLA